MTSLHPRHSFTPQRSPSFPSSQASQSPPASDGRPSRNVIDAEPSQQQRTSINSSALNCWTAHQSHGQVTILFYVPRWTKKEDLQIVFGSNHVIAGIRSAKEMVVQAQLAGRINTATSTWRLEKQSNKRSRSLSRSHSRAGGKKVATYGSNSSSEGREIGDKASGAAQGAATTKRASTARSGSPASSDEASNSDPLARSVDTLDSAGGWDHVRQSSASTPPEAFPALPGNARSAPRLDQSMTLSEESGYIASGSNSTGDGGVRSLESSIHSQSSASQARSDDDIITDAKLITLHLDKVDGGIWPFLVSGPASLTLVQPDSVNRSPLLSQSNFQSLNAALSEAQRQPSLEKTDGSIVLADEGADHLDNSFTQSTITVDSMYSDDSTTVLGTQASGQEEDLYEMDPTSLALMGIRHSKQGARSPFANASTLEAASAFEYFKRAWRRAEIPLATKRLVEDYLPLFPLQSNNGSNMLRSRLTASLGGPTALARLYVSYARLHLPCFQDRQSPLAFPLGGLTNPFGGGHGQDYLSSPRSQGDQPIGHDALTYLREARNIDKNVVIGEEEWNEAKALAIHSPSGEEGWRWDPVEGANRVSESEKASQGRQSAREDYKRDRKRKKKMGSKLHRADSGRNNDKLSSDQGLVFVLVSRVALLSVMVAGGVAVAGWWRRAATAGSGS